MGDNSEEKKNMCKILFHSKSAYLTMHGSKDVGRRVMENFVKVGDINTIETIIVLSK